VLSPTYQRRSRCKLPANLKEKPHRPGQPQNEITLWKFTGVASSQKSSVENNSTGAMRRLLLDEHQSTSTKTKKASQINLGGFKNTGNTYFRTFGTIIGSESLTTVFEMGTGMTFQI
jgi:hypothetical protein